MALPHRTGFAFPLFLIGALAFAQPAATNQTAALLQDLIRINTSNPPGNEGAVAAFLASKLKPLGFEIDIIETPQPGKAHFIARLKGDGSKKPILLAAHADVVGVEREKWTLDPFAGVIRDGYVYGRGALDFKGGLAVFTEAVMMLARNKVPLARDVILLSEADEEGGRYNTGWLAQSHWDKIDCEFSLNEGGWIIKRPGSDKVRYVSISTADKLGVSLIFTARGKSTHSSMPQPDSAIFTLAKALAKIADYDTQPFLIPSTRAFFLTLAKTSEPPMSTYFTNLVNGTPEQVKEADREISKDPLLHAIMRNTIAPVLMNAGFRGNVIPGSAEATLNFRMVPGTNVADLIGEMQRVVDDPRVEIKQASGAGGAGTRPLAELERMRKTPPSTLATDLYAALVKESNAVYPEAAVTPYLFQAGTDSMAWRSRGVPVYGIYPYPIDAEDLSRMHGNDERVSVESLRTGTELIYKTLVDVAAARK